MVCLVLNIRIYLNSYYYIICLEDTKQWSRIEIFGHGPPSRLDFAYCRMKFKVAIKPEEEEESSTVQNQKEAYFMVIHGGMDTEGNIFDDLFFINLE